MLPSHHMVMHGCNKRYIEAVIYNGPQICNERVAIELVVLTLTRAGYGVLIPTMFLRMMGTSVKTLTAETVDQAWQSMLCLS